MSDVRSTPAAPRAAPPHWAHLLATQWRYLQLFKLLGICVFLTIFFQAYFVLLNHPVRPVMVMPLTPLDAWIGFEPAAFWVYVSLWIYVGIAPGLMPSWRRLLLYGAWAAGLCGAGLLCFYLWPTVVPPQVHQLDPSAAQHPGFAVLRGLDAAGNACPSLHVATAVFSACWIERLLVTVRAPALLRGLNVLWLLLIAWSTVAVRQHVVLDGVAGALLGVVFAWLSLRCSAPPRAAAVVQPL